MGEIAISVIFVLLNDTNTISQIVQQLIYAVCIRRIELRLPIWEISFSKSSLRFPFLFLALIPIHCSIPPLFANSRFVWINQSVLILIPPNTLGAIAKPMLPLCPISPDCSRLNQAWEGGF
jgi:hypothetical protein